MNTILQIRLAPIFSLLMLLVLSGCSVVDSYRSPQPSSARSLPKIPEIKQHKRVIPRMKIPRNVVVSKPKAQVKSSSYQIKNKPVVAKVIKPKITQQQKIDEQKRLQQLAKQKATVEIDPYATIPESSSAPKVIPKNTSPTTGFSSPAVKSLMTSARADIALGRSRSAISKLERGLRIEPQNAQLWHMLARAHYSNSAYLHAVSMAKKSNSNTNNSELINENWKLIKQAGERSGNASVIKEALDYMKLNP